MDYFIPQEDTTTFSTDIPKVFKLMLAIEAYKKFVSEPAITSSLELDEEFIDREHMEIITKAREEYKKGKVISEEELFKRLEKSARRNE